MMLAMTNGRAQASRRVLLASLAGGLLTGCSVRLERGAPKLPGIKTQAPPKDTAAFQALVDRLSTTIDALEGQSHPWAAKLRSVHQQQESRVLAVAASAGMQLSTPTPSPSTSSSVSSPTTSPTGSTSASAAPGTTPTATPTPTPTYPPSDAAPVEAAGVAPAALAVATGVATDYRPMFLSVAATQVTGAALLGGPVNWSGDRLPASVATALLPAMREAVYGMEIVAARTKIRDRAVIISSLHTMYAARTRVEVAAGSSAPPDPNDYTLPIQPTDAASSRSLVQKLSEELVAACASQARTPTDFASAAGLVRLWSDALGVLWTWNGTRVPFPGLTGTSAAR